MNLAGCVICSDLFNDLNSISAAPCGHVYHTDCLKSWVATSKTCPECRSKTYLKTIRKLYFNYVSKSNLSSLDLESKITYFTTQLSAKNEELEALEKERDEIISFMRGPDKKDFKIKDSVFELVKEVQELRVKAKDVPKLEAKVLMLENMNSVFCNDSSIYEVCDRTIKRLQDCKDALKDYGDYFKTCLKQELPKAVKSNDKLQDLNCKLKCENRTYAVEKRRREDAMELRNRVLSTSSLERLFPSVDFDEKNPFALTDTKSKFSNEMHKMLRREKLYGDAMELRKRVFIESTSLETFSPLEDFDEKNVFTATTTKSKFSKEMGKMLERENYTHIAEKRRKDAMKKRKAKLNALGKNMRKKASAPASSAASTSRQNNLELPATVSSRKKPASISSAARVKKR